MKSNKISISRQFNFLLIALFMITGTTLSSEKDWQREEVNWRLGKNRTIKAIKYPKGKKPLSYEDKKNLQAGSETLTAQIAAAQTQTSVVSNIIDSPPINGFVPWIVVGTTDGREEDLVVEAVKETSLFPPVTGYITADDLRTDYVVGIFDTGASAHVMGHGAATQLGLFKPNPSSDLVTNNTIDITGVTGSVQALISYPLGVFIDGIGALEPNAPGEDLYVLNDYSGMVGQTNVAIVVGQEPGSGPDLPTAIGTPLSVYYTTVINNESPITVNYQGEQYTGPDIKIYDFGDSRIPEYKNALPLELKPLGGLSVQYIPNLTFYDYFEVDLEDLFELLGTPGSPSIITGNSSQSVFFAHSVDLSHNENNANDKNRFMVDTGAQVSVIGSRIGARLGLTDEYDFIVEVEGVTGEDANVPGYYIDSINIPALGEWLRFTNVPVILLDIYSPEGGTLDGIIGMNLFTEYNMVLRGGGLFLTDDPMIYFERIVWGDIDPPDDKVDHTDLMKVAQAWLSTMEPLSANWNPDCDIAPAGNPDGKIDYLDFALLSRSWGL